MANLTIPGLEDIPIENYLGGTFFGNTVLQYAIFLGYLIAAILIGRVTYFFFTTTVRRLTQKTKTKFDDIVIDMSEEPLIFAIVIFGFYLGYQQLTLSERATEVFVLITKNLITINVFWFIIRIFDQVIENYLKPLSSKTKTDLDDHLVPMLKRLVKYSLGILALVIVLSNFGINVTSVVAGLGIGGLAIALAAQETLRNFLGGIAILTDKPFKLGDWVEIDQYSGTVQEIGMRSTRLKTLGGEFVTIPNHIISTNSTVNYHRFSKRKITFVLGLTYDMSDEKIEKAKDIIKKILEKTEKVVKDSYEIKFVQFNSSSLDLDVRFEVDTNSGPKMRKIKDAVNTEIKKEFKKSKIEMAFPTQTIELKK